MPPKLVRHSNVGNMELRVLASEKEFIGIILVNGNRKFEIRSQEPDHVWNQLHAQVGKLNPQYVGFEGARNRFLHFFPDGFHSDKYVAAERKYKFDAKDMLDSQAPLARAADEAGFGEAVLAVFRKTDLLFPIEKARIQELLRGPNSDRFIHGAARFALGDARVGLAEMEAALKRHNAVSWTAVTYLPFLWRPDKHMFLKPEVTKDFAARVGHRFAFDYQPRLNVAVYDSLIDLAATTERELSGLHPRDRIDIQSFIWVVGDYKEEAGAKSTER